MIDLSKITMFCLSIVIFSALTARGDDEEIALDDCPPAVKKTIRDESRGGTIDSVTKTNEDGDISYWAEVVIGGKLYGIGVDEEGKLTEFSLQVDDHEIGLTDCPLAVQKTFRAEADKSRITDIRRETRFGGVLYVTEVNIAGKDYVIKVAEDGTLFEKILLVEEKELTLTDCPPAVRKTMDEECKGNSIGDVVRSNGIGKPVYMTEISINGTTFKLEVAEDGALISKTREDD